MWKPKVLSFTILGMLKATTALGLLFMVAFVAPPALGVPILVVYIPGISGAATAIVLLGKPYPRAYAGILLFPLALLLLVLNPHELDQLEPIMTSSTPLLFVATGMFVVAFVFCAICISVSGSVNRPARNTSHK